MEVDGNVLRSEFEGRPNWAGTRGGNGEGQHKQGGNRGQGFVDADGDGVCDNMQ